MPDPHVVGRDEYGRPARGRGQPNELMGGAGQRGERRERRGDRCRPAFFPSDPGGVDDDAKQGRLTVPLGQAWNKGLSIEMGQAPVKQYNVYLRDLILSHRARPSFIVSHRLPLQEGPDAYEKFDQRAPGYTKVLLKP